MHRLLSITALVLVVGAARAASAAIPECCACIAGFGDAMTSAPAAPPKPALFCGFVTPMTSSAFNGQCNHAGGMGIACFPTVANETCTETLTQSDIACPPPSPAPAAGTWGLKILALGLAALGVHAVRRRSRWPRD